MRQPLKQYIKRDPDVLEKGMHRGTFGKRIQISDGTRLRWTMSVESASKTLASYRSKNTRKAQETFEKGLVLLKSGKHSKLGDEGKPIRALCFKTHCLFCCQNGRS